MKLARTLGLTKLATGIVAASISVLAMTAPALSAERIKAEWWHALRGRLTPIAEELVTKFNASQDKYEIKAVLKGTYEESQAAMVAAYRVKQHPVLMQTSERTFLTMYKSGAVNLVSDFMQEQGYTIDWSNFVPPVAGYYLVDGKPAAMPFNSSTPVFWYNADQFKAAGFDKPGETWQEVVKQLYAIKEKGISDCPMALASDFVWSMIENYSAIQNQEYGTKANGFGGLDTEFTFNKSPLIVGQVERLSKMVNDNVLQIAGQGLNPEELFISGKCSTIMASTAAHTGVEAGAKFKWGTTFLPHEEGIEPKNSTIGGGALWVLKNRPGDEYKAIAAFLNYLASPEVQVWWATQTGYVPVTNAAYDKMKADGYFKEHPTREIAILQLNRGTPTDNSRGFRFGNHNPIFNMQIEEFQSVWSRTSTPQEALDRMAARGNEILRQYEKLNAGN
jgi:sn-glycerol 3-phosphate transport system substrate-binding protein